MYDERDLFLLRSFRSLCSISMSHLKLTPQLAPPRPIAAAFRLSRIAEDGDCFVEKREDSQLIPNLKMIFLYFQILCIELVI